jgi:hypothetical protein
MFRSLPGIIIRDSCESTNYITETFFNLGLDVDGLSTSRPGSFNSGKKEDKAKGKLERIGGRNVERSASVGGGGVSENGNE